MHKKILKWIEGLNLHIKALIFLQESKGVHLHYLWLGIDFLDDNEVQLNKKWIHQILSKSNILCFNGYYQ